MDGVPGLRDFTDTASEIRLDGHLLEMIVRIYYSLHLLGKVYIIFSCYMKQVSSQHKMYKMKTFASAENGVCGSKRIPIPLFYIMVFHSTRYGLKK